MTRQWRMQSARREKVPILVGIAGASGSGKTFSALRIARGMQEVIGGDIAVIDTEARRALHYADRFRFHHIQFDAPFGSLDYLEALEYAHAKGARNIVVDSCSHEHEGSGGMLEYHEAEVKRLGGTDYAKRERVKMLAWQAPKGARRRLINRILQMEGNFVFCFRAKKGLKIRTGEEPLELGWVPISGDEWVYEMTLSCLLYPASGGVPTWRTQYPGERMAMKLPAQFRDLFLSEPRAIDEGHGRALAQWARGGDAPAATPAPSRLGAEGQAGELDEGAPADEPCWAPVAGRRCRLVAGHRGGHEPESSAPEGEGG